MVKFVSQEAEELLLVSFLPAVTVDRCEPNVTDEDSSDTFIDNLVHCSVLSSLIFVKCSGLSEVGKELGFIEVEEILGRSLSTQPEFEESNPWASVSSTEEDVSDVAVVHGVVCGVGTKVGPLPLDGWKGAQ